MNDPIQAAARARALLTLEMAAKAGAPRVAVFDGGLEKDELQHALRQLTAYEGIIAKLKIRNNAQRATIRRAYKLLRKQGFTLKSV